MTERGYDGVSTPDSARRFATTRWSLVRSAGGDAAHDSNAGRALAELCASYWYPLYAYVRRKGVDIDEARDLTQAFFAMLLERRDLATADPQRGRFRSFLLGAMNHFLSNHWRAERAVKRGGGRHVASLDIDLDDGESRYRREPAHDVTAERVFERRWALTVLEQAMDALRQEMDDAGRAAQFDTLRGYLDGSTDTPYAQVAAELGMTEVAARVAVHRLRDKYRRCLRRMIGETVATEAEIDAELRALLAALAATG
ncbi:MAG: sigma-70 family RNA polymerase sigma factor [Phycisphaera sp.]|nr:sigma-70 family RNA polymerase sigma factor [Phycisphaera sp.]